MWPYLEIGLHKGNQVQMRSLGWVLMQHDWCPYKKGHCTQRHTYKEDNVKTQGEQPLQAKECVRPPEVRREAQKSLPHSPQKEPTLPTHYSTQIAVHLSLSGTTDPLWCGPILSLQPQFPRLPYLDLLVSPSSNQRRLPAHFHLDYGSVLFLGMFPVYHALPTSLFHLNLDIL